MSNVENKKTNSYKLTGNVLITTILTILIVIAILIIVYINKFQIIRNSVEESSKETQFNPMYFQIYDKSNDVQCDRLIIVEPFGWVIWAKYGKVYVLNDTNFDCSLGTTPAVLVPSTTLNEADYTFKSLCINILYTNIFDMYNNVTPVRVDFNIEELQQQPDKFTVLDALNYLFTRYITMTDEKEVRRFLTMKSENNAMFTHADNHTRHQFLNNQSKISHRGTKINNMAAYEVMVDQRSKKPIERTSSYFNGKIVITNSPNYYKTANTFSEKEKKLILDKYTNHQKLYF